MGRGPEGKDLWMPLNTTSTSSQAAPRDPKRTTAIFYRHSSSQTPYQSELRPPLHIAGMLKERHIKVEILSRSACRLWGYKTWPHPCILVVSWLLEQFKRIWMRRTLWDGCHQGHWRRVWQRQWLAECMMEGNNDTTSKEMMTTYSIQASPLPRHAHIISRNYRRDSLPRTIYRSIIHPIFQLVYPAHSNGDSKEIRIMSLALQGWSLLLEDKVAVMFLIGHRYKRGLWWSSRLSR